jgi:type IV pilus assembly protein PilW
MRSHSRHLTRPLLFTRGFSLVEIMVGMVIGLLGVLIIMQVFAVSEGQKRTTTSGNDAQTNGALALFTLEQDLRQAGWGIASPALLDCASTAHPTIALPTVATAAFRLVPVEINPTAFAIPAGDANTDVVLVGYSSASIVTGVLVDKIANPNADFVIANPAEFNAGDMVVATPTCAGDQLNKVTGVHLSHPNAAGGALSQTNGLTGDHLFNLGPNPTVRAYAIRAGNLTACDLTTSDCTKANNFASVGSDIVSLRAIYGKDTSATADGIVDVWDRVKPTNGLAWSRVLALRIELVARSNLRERPDASSLDRSGNTCTITTDKSQPDKQTWMGQSVAGAEIDLSSTGADWTCYRYKLYQTVVPLRNMIWAQQ